MTNAPEALSIRHLVAHSFLASNLRRMAVVALLAAVWLSLANFAGPLNAQELETFDPDVSFEQAPATNEVEPSSDAVIDGDLVDRPADRPTGPLPEGAPLPVAKPLGQAPTDAEPEALGEELEIYSEPPVEGAEPALETTANVERPVSDGPSAAYAENTYAEDDLIGAAEGVFGKGAKGLAKMIEGLLKKEGRPNGYIVGREAGGAFVVGARYGSGTLHHKIEGERKVYWTGPSVGFDAGANAANTFVLVYNLWDSEDLFKRYPAGEGQAYLVGGLHASYVRRGDVVLIPIRMGAGVRLGVNAGYMRFSKKQRWLPF